MPSQIILTLRNKGSFKYDDVKPCPLILWVLTIEVHLIILQCFVQDDSEYFKKELVTDDEEDSKDITPIITMTEPVSFENVDIKVEQDFEKDFINGLTRSEGENLQMPRLKYSCNDCDFSTNWRRNLRRHKKRMHLEANSGSNVSALVFSSNVDFEKHENDNISDIQEALKAESLQGDIQFQNNASENIVKDKMSSKLKKLKVKSVIKKSIIGETKKGEIEKCNLCEQCGKSFNSNGALRLHVEGAHKTEDYRCDLCDYSCYGAKRNLLIHRRKIHNVGKNNFLCDQCDYVTGSSNQLRDHINIKHLGKTFPCTLCDHVAYYTQSLSDHVRRVHRNKRYPCDACDKEFMSNEGLRNHQDSAHNDSSYPCSQCESILKNRAALRKHIRIKHESPMMQCEFCDYSTQNKTNMKCHTVHKHGDEKFKCKLCRYDTIKAEYLEKHVKEKHMVSEPLL